jgi:hypothetical protein
MSLRKVLLEWLDAGVKPDGTAQLSADDQRSLVADIYTVEPSFLQDALADSLARYPTYANEIVQALRTADLPQLGAVVDKICRGNLIGSNWLETEMREVSEQESFYDGDQ